MILRSNITLLDNLGNLMDGYIRFFEPGTTNLIGYPIEVKHGLLMECPKLPSFVKIAAWKYEASAHEVDIGEAMWAIDSFNWGLNAKTPPND